MAKSAREVYYELKAKNSKLYDYLFVGSDWSGKMHYEDEWKIIKTALEDFVKKEYKIYHTYRNYTRYSDWFMGYLEDEKYNFDIIGVNLGIARRENNKTMVIIFARNEFTLDGKVERTKGTFSRSIPDFLDPDFETNYTERLRNKALEAVTEKINKLMDTLGSLIEEQEKLQKEIKEGL